MPETSAASGMSRRQYRGRRRRRRRGSRRSRRTALCGCGRVEVGRATLSTRIGGALATKQSNVFRRDSWMPRCARNDRSWDEAALPLTAVIAPANGQTDVAATLTRSRPLPQDAVPQHYPNAATAPAQARNPRPPPGNNHAPTRFGVPYSRSTPRRASTFSHGGADVGAG